MAEKRKHKRAILISYLDIYDTGSNLEVGYVVDISNGGMQLISKDAIPVEQTFSYTIEIPNEVHESGIFSVNASSIRSTQDEFLDYYNTGFSFEDLNPEQAAIVDNIIAALEL